VLGAMVGALASGRLRLAPDGTPLSDSMAWLSPFTVATGILTASLFAFLAAVYLAIEAKGELVEDFRRRALWAGGLVFVAALVSLGLCWRESPVIFAGLTERWWSAPLFLATGAAALGAFLSLLRHRFVAARILAAAEAALLITGWAAAQLPYLVVPDVTLARAAAPVPTQVALLVALGVGALTLVPSLWLLFRVFKGPGARGAGGASHPLT